MVQPREDHKLENNIYDSHERYCKGCSTLYSAAMKA